MDFKALRENQLKWSREELAEALEVNVETIEHWENTGGVPFDVIAKITQISGLKMEDILSYEKPKVKRVEPDYTWETVDFTKKSIINYISKKLEECAISEENQKKYIIGLEEGLKRTWIKPRISIVGRSDTGKSTLINALIGMEKMPTAWTPTTAIAVYIKHLDDRPEFIKEDAWIFADQVNNEVVWDVKKINDREYCEQWKIAQGNVEILRSYGIRQENETAQKAGAAVVFLDAPILKDCDIVDLPGFGTETESDDTITFKVAQQTDILIYLSQANGFMRIEDITYLKENVRNLPIWEKKDDNDLKPLSNLYVVASQAHTVSNGSKIQLSNILKKGYENFCKTISKEYWQVRQKESGYVVEDYNQEIFKKRFFTYTTDIPALCERFISDLQRTVEKLPKLVEERVKDFLNVYVKSQIPSLEKEIAHYNGLLDKREEYKKLLANIDANELNRMQKNDENKKKVRDRIEVLREESWKEFSQYYGEMVNTDNIVKMLKDSNITNKKEDVECFASRFQELIMAKGNDIIASKDDKLSLDIQEYVEAFEENVKINFEKVSIEMEFDATVTFATALAAIGILGGLGAYLAGKAILIWGSFSFLAGIGGTIALNSLAWGPIGIAIGLIIATGLTVVKLFGGLWEKSLAKKIVEIYDKENVLGTVRNSFNVHWDETKEAFEKTSAKLDEEWNKYVEDLREMLNIYDEERINEKVIELENMKSFFENIPL